MGLANDNSPYWVHSAIEIAYALNELRKSRTPMTCEIPRLAETFTTEILAVEVDKPGLILDVPPLRAQLETTLRADEVYLKTATAAIRFEFELKHIVSVQWDGAPALRSELPSRILKIQRRNFFRIGIPRARAVSCVVSTPDVTPFGYQVLDIGLGGVALASREGEPQLEEGKVYEKCRIALPEVGTIEPNVLVRHVAVTRAANMTPMYRYGCEFVNLPGPQESAIQRFVLHLERDRRAAGKLVDN